MELLSTLLPTGTPNLTSTVASTATTSLIITTTSAETNITTESYNVTQPLIFLQTAAAEGIAGTFAFAAILITVHQVSHLCVNGAGKGARDL